MAKPKRKTRTREYVVRETIDITPERLAKGDPFEWVNPAEIDDTEQPIGRNRRFRSAPLDRFHANSMITYRQYEAGDQFRNAWHGAGFFTSIVASYGERTSKGEPSYGLPRTLRQITCRQFCRAIMADLTFAENRFMTRFLVNGHCPRFRGSKHIAHMREIRRCLDMMADYIKLA